MHKNIICGPSLHYQTNKHFINTIATTTIMSLYMYVAYDLACSTNLVHTTYYSGFHLIGLLLIGFPGCCYLVTICVQGCDKVATTWKFD